MKCKCDVANGDFKKERGRRERNKNGMTKRQSQKLEKDWTKTTTIIIIK